MSMML